jgi:hypothetical protein
MTSACKRRPLSAAAGPVVQTTWSCGRKWQIGTVPGFTLSTWNATCLGFQPDVSAWHTATASTAVPSLPSIDTEYARVCCVKWHANTAYAYGSAWQATRRPPPARFTPVTVYSCLGEPSLPTTVDAALTWLVPRLAVAKSTMDSSDVAHAFLSPLAAGASQSCSVCAISAASTESGSTEKRPRISGTFSEENGMASASLRGRNLAPAIAVLANWTVVFLPGCRSSSRKKSATLAWGRRATASPMRRTRTGKGRRGRGRASCPGSRGRQPCPCQRPPWCHPACRTRD